MLTEYAGKVFDENQATEVYRYIKKLQLKWDKIEENVFQAIIERLIINRRKKSEYFHLGENIPTKLKCYVVKNCRYSGISDPLTVRMDKDFDYVFDTLIHELAHILIGHNFKKYKKIEKNIKRLFPEIKDSRIIRHIYVNFIELKVLRKIFSSRAIEKILKRAKKFKISKAYEIVLKNEEILEDLITTI
jgi:hypothetical protein